MTIYIISFISVIKFSDAVNQMHIYTYHYHTSLTKIICNPNQPPIFIKIHTNQLSFYNFYEFYCESLSTYHDTIDITNCQFDYNQAGQTFAEDSSVVICNNQVSRRRTHWLFNINTSSNIADEFVKVKRSDEQRNG